MPVPTQIRATISCGLLIRLHNLTYVATNGQRIFYQDGRKNSVDRVIHNGGFALVPIHFRAHINACPEKGRKKSFYPWGLASSERKSSVWARARIRQSTRCGVPGTPKPIDSEAACPGNTLNRVIHRIDPRTRAPRVIFIMSERSGRGGRIRTYDPLYPKQVRYQTAPRPGPWRPCRQLCREWKAPLRRAQELRDKSYRTRSGISGVEVPGQARDGLRQTYSASQGHAALSPITGWRNSLPSEMPICRARPPLISSTY